MLNQSKRNPVGFVVVYKKDGIIMEFQRTPKKEPRIHAHMQTAINAVKKLRASYQDGGEWVAMTTQRLADIHRREWDKARV
jgi:hypothetical protein